MRFYIRRDARDWFSDLKGNGFDIDFDPYYFCFIAGIVTGRKSSEKGSDVAELVDYFPGRYNTRGKLLVALFLSRELEELGVDMSEKKTVHAVISRLVKPEAPNYLSEDGGAEFNKYAHGGFKVLLDWFDDRPRLMDTFLRAFKMHVDNV